MKFVCVRVCVRVRVCAQTSAHLRPKGNNLHQNENNLRPTGRRRLRPCLCLCLRCAKMSAHLRQTHGLSRLRKYQRPHTNHRWSLRGKRSPAADFSHLRFAQNGHQMETSFAKMKTICAQLGAAVCIRVCVRVSVCAQTSANLRPKRNNLRQNENNLRPIGRRRSCQCLCLCLRCAKIGAHLL